MVPWLVLPFLEEIIISFFDASITDSNNSININPRIRSIFVLKNLPLIFQNNMARRFIFLGRHCYFARGYLDESLNFFIEIKSWIRGSSNLKDSRFLMRNHRYSEIINILPVLK